jgi:hypothetical protein
VQGWVSRLDEDLRGMNPQTPAQEAAFLQLLEQQDKRIDARRARLSEANRELPAPAWFVLGLDEMERQLVIVEAEQVSAPQLCDTEGRPL